MSDQNATRNAGDLRVPDEPTRFSLLRRAAALARAVRPGLPKDLRINLAKRQYEAELRASGLSRNAAKIAVAVRFRGNNGKAG